MYCLKCKTYEVAPPDIIRRCKPCIAEMHRLLFLLNHGTLSIQVEGYQLLDRLRDELLDPYAVYDLAEWLNSHRASVTPPDQHLDVLKSLLDRVGGDVENDALRLVESLPDTIRYAYEYNSNNPGKYGSVPGFDWGYKLGYKQYPCSEVKALA